MHFECLSDQVIADFKYLEIKYLDDVPYTDHQKGITQNIPASVSEKYGNPIYDIFGTEIVPNGGIFTIQEVKRITVNTNSLAMELK